MPSPVDANSGSADVRQPASHRRASRVWLAAVGCVLLAALAVAVYFSRQEAGRERWLRQQSTESLRQMAAPEDADALTRFVYARRLFDTGASADARVPAAGALSALPKEAQTDLAGRIFALYGCLAAEYGDEGEAVAYLQRAERIGGANPLIPLGRGMLALRQNRKVDAVAALKPAADADPGCAEAWKQLGKAYLLGAEPELAVAALRRATALAPKDALLQADLGQALLQAKQFPEAEQAYQTVAALAPNDPYYATLPLRVMAFAARSEADYARACDLLRAALTRNPADDGLRAELAGLHLRFNQLKPSRQELETILTHNPVISAECWLNLYTVCKRMGDTRAATEAHSRFRQLIEQKHAVTAMLDQAQLHPDDARLMLRLSTGLLRLGQVQQAYAALSRAASLAPNDPEIARAMAGAQAIMRSQQGATPPNNNGVLPQ